MFLAVLAASACRPPSQREAAQDPANEEVARVPSLPVAEPPMDRAALLLAAAKAASAAALGQDDVAAQRSLDGKRFEFRIRFGCPTVTISGEAAGHFEVRYNPDDRTLRIRAAPDLTLDDPAVAALAGKEVEATEGFWIRRPWLLSAGCLGGPPQPASAAPSSAPARAKSPPADAAEGPASRVPIQRIGVADFFTEADSRTGRRGGRAYETTRVLGPDEQPSREGYDIVLSGRLRKLADGRVIACSVIDADRRPLCLVSADFDRVRINNPGSRELLAEWGR